MIRVGRCIYNKDGSRNDPSFNGFTSIIILMKSHSYWGELGPYDVADENGRILENIWQFAKVYEKVPPSKQFYSRYSKTIVWNHPGEVHEKNGKVTSEYLKWRKKGMENKYPVRYPVGFQHRHKCKYALYDNSDGTINETKLDYVASRKVIYVKEYCSLVKKEPKFKELQDKLKNGENLLIIEVDGPHEESLDYYKNKYKVANDFIQNGTMLVNEANINVMLNDTKHPFGHGYCLAMALLDKEIEWNK